MGINYVILKFIDYWKTKIGRLHYFTVYFTYIKVGTNSGTPFPESMIMEKKRYIDMTVIID